MRLDHYLPKYDFVERHQIVVNSPPERILEAVWNLDLTKSQTAKILFSIRNTIGRLINKLKPWRNPEKAAPLELTIKGLIGKTGFIYLDQVKNEEAVVGLVGKFWTSTAGIVRGLRADELERFSERGYAKAAANFYVQQNPDGYCTLSTETRVLCLGPKAKFLFSFYWMIIRPFSGWIRHEMLRLVKEQAERDGK